MVSQTLHMLKQAVLLILQPDMSSKGSGYLSWGVEVGENTLSTRKPKGLRKKMQCSSRLLMRGKSKNHTRYLPVIGSVNYITNVHELAPILRLNSSKGSLFCKEKAVVLTLSSNRMKNVWSS